MDFNVRTPNELLFVEYPEIKKNLDLFLQEIDIVISTPNGSIMGNRNFGVDLEAMLWQTNYNENTILGVVREQIKMNCNSGQFFNWDVKFSVTKGSIRDIGLLDVTIKEKQNNEIIARTNYVFK